MRRTVTLLLPVAAALALGACAKQSTAENAADQLDNAAAQSDPAAAAELENAADAIRDNEVDVAVNAPGSAAQQALENAGEAQARSQ
jgi:hypothetical protein